MEKTMDIENDTRESSIKTLRKYKETAENPANHPDMIKDKTILHFLAYVLDDTDPETLEIALDTMQLLGENGPNRTRIIRTFGVVQSLERLAANDCVKDGLRNRAKRIVDMITTPDPSKEKLTRNKVILTLHVFGLHEETRKELEDILMKKVKGVHSVMVDVEHQRCTVMAYEQIDTKLLAVALSENTKMEARLVSKNKLNQEILVSLTDELQPIDLQELPPYLEEKESPVKEKAVRSMKEIRIVASEWFSVAAGIIQRSIYW